MRQLTPEQANRAVIYLQADEGEYLSIGGTGRTGAGFSRRGGQLYRISMDDELRGPIETEITPEALLEHLESIDLDASEFELDALRQLGIPLPSDPVDRAMSEASEALLNDINLWYGDAALKIRNFKTRESTVVHRHPSTEHESGKPLRAALEKLKRVMPAEPRVLALAMSEAGPYLEADCEVDWRPTTIAEAGEILERHLASSQMTAARPRGPEVFAPFAGHQIWNLGERRYNSIETTAIFAFSPERAALFEYVGDGP